MLTAVEPYPVIPSEQRSCLAVPHYLGQDLAAATSICSVLSATSPSSPCLQGLLDGSWHGARKHLL